MKKLALFVIVLPFILLLTQFTCEDEIVNEYPTEAKAYFWTNDGSVASQRLYIDDFYSSAIPYIDDDLTRSGKTIIVEKGLMVPVTPGKYRVMLLDSNENMITKGELSLKFGRNKTKISSSWNNDKCKVHVVYGD